MSKHCCDCKYYQNCDNTLLFRYGFCCVQGYEVLSDDTICNEFDDKFEEK